MPNLDTSYTCKICQTPPKQKSHIEEHLKTSKHKDKRKIFQLELECKEESYLQEEYGTTDIEQILKNLEMFKEVKDKPKKIIKKKDDEEFDKVIENKTIWTHHQTPDENPNFQEYKSLVESVVKHCHQLLYNNGSIVGVKALNDIVRVLLLKFLEPQFKDKDSAIWQSINSNKDIKNLSESKFNTYIKIGCDITEFRKVESPLNYWKNFVKNFLSKILGDIYQDEDESFNLKEDSVFIDIINKINTINVNEEFINSYSSTCGDIHEAFRAYGGKKGAKELGQFFTPRKLINLIFYGLDINSLCSSMINPTIYDPCMGTGGFLTRIYKLMDIKPENIYGCETELDTIKFAYSSLLLTTGKTYSNLEKCDSLCRSSGLPNRKHDIIVTNPPFGTSMKYDELKQKYNSEYPNSEVKFEDIYPVKANNGACLFTQMCVHKLSNKGLCAIVLPDGELFEGNGGWSKKFRKWFIGRVNIRTILKVPSGTFDHAGVSTNVVIFTKDGLTEEITYFSTNKECSEIKTMFKVSREDLEKALFNLDSERYIKKQSDIYDVPIVKLGDVCEIVKGVKTNSKLGKDKGQYPLFYCSILGNLWIDSFNYDGEALIINSTNGSGKCAVYYISGKYNVGNSTFHFRSNKNTLINKYLFHYLKRNINILQNEFKGPDKKSITKERLFNIKIPLPSLEVQQQIVDELSQIELSIESLNKRISELKREKDQYKKYGRKAEIRELLKNSEEKMLSEVCEVKGGKGINDRSKDKKNDYIYPYYDSNGIKGFVKEQLFNGEYIVTARKLSIGSLHYVNGYYSPSDNTINITSLDKKTLSNKYIYYWFKDNSHILIKMSSGIKPGIRMTEVRLLKIPIPSQEIQKQCIQIFEEKEEVINQLQDRIESEKNHIETLNNLAKDIITSFCSTNLT